MEQFYKVLSSYNKAIEYKIEWPNMYKQNKPPIYWEVLSEVMKGYDRKCRCLEIGSGAGDILALLFAMNYTDTYGVERDPYLVEIANKKLKTLFGIEKRCIEGEFPNCTIPDIEILIMVNCVYWENVWTKEDYIRKIQQFYEVCKKPAVFILEVIDDVDNQSDVYPQQVRLQEDDVKDMFGACKITKVNTYRYPQNTSSKCLYIIEK